MKDHILNALLEEIGAEPVVEVVALGSDAAGSTRGASWQEMADDKWVLLGTLFFVTAVLGLPLLWKSRAFSGLAKAVLSVLIVVYTAFLFWLVYLVMMWSYARIAAEL